MTPPIPCYRLALASMSAAPVRRLRVIVGPRAADIPFRNEQLPLFTTGQCIVTVMAVNDSQDEDQQL